MYALATYTRDAGLFVTFHDSEDAALIAAAAEALDLAGLEDDGGEVVADPAAISIFCNDYGVDYQFSVTKVPG